MGELEHKNQLADYAKFLAKNIGKVSKKHTDLLIEAELPFLMNFPELSHEDLLNHVTPRLLKLFSGLQDGSALQTAKAEMELLRSDKFPDVPISALNLEDFTITYSVRYKLFAHFLPDYTQNLETALAIMAELEDFSKSLQDHAFRVYVEVRDKLLEEKNRKLTEAYHELRSEKDLNENILDTSIDGIVAFDKDLRYTAWNAAMVELTGVTKKTAIGKTIYELFPHFVNSRVEGYFRKALTGVKVQIAPTHYILREGLYEGYVAPLKNEQGEISGGISVLRDITELKSKENELRLLSEKLEQKVNERTNDLFKANHELTRLNKELEDFAYTVSHDLKAPLRAIASIAEFLLQDYGKVLGKDGLAQIELLQSRIRRMSGLIEGILLYSKTARGESDKDEIDLSSMVDDVIEALVTTDKATVVKKDLPVVTFPPVQMFQILQNLLSNALNHASAENLIIEIGSEKTSDGEYMIFVKDNGAGIDEKYFDRIFRPFQTLLPRDQKEGTGIGLSLAKKIIEKEGGRIWVESTPGNGATFRFTVKE